MRLVHPHIAPPLHIEVEDEKVPEFTEAGWLPAPADHTDDPADPGVDD